MIWFCSIFDFKSYHFVTSHPSCFMKQLINFDGHFQPFCRNSSLEKQRVEGVWTMRFSPLLVASLLFLLPDHSTECCCNWWYSCRCNFFGCNCDTDDAGYCYEWTYRYNHGDRICIIAPKNPEHCENGRRRKKRSVTGTILEAEYAGGIYNHLMD